MRVPDGRPAATPSMESLAEGWCLGTEVGGFCGVEELHLPHRSAPGQTVVVEVSSAAAEELLAMMTTIVDAAVRVRRVAPRAAAAKELAVALAAAGVAAREDADLGAERAR